MGSRVSLNLTGLPPQMEMRFHWTQSDQSLDFRLLRG